MIKKIVAKIVAVLLPLGVVGGAVYVAVALLASAPETERVDEPRLAPLVSIVDIQPQTIQRVVEAYGTVLPAQEVVMSAEVEGRVVELHPSLQPGGLIKEGELLLKIDAAEYELALSRAEAAVAEAEAALEVEQGRQRVAEREWELFGKDLPDSEMGRELMLREPQMNQAKAQIDSAKSNVEQAKLDLRRTELYAPFDALVLNEQVDLGQHVSPGEAIAALVGTDKFWVQASVPMAHLAALLQAAQSGEDTVEVYANVEGTGPPTAQGKLVRHLGRVDPDGRMAQVLVEVPNPLMLGDAETGSAPLPLDSYVRVDLHAGALENVVPIPWPGIRENNELWLASAEDLLNVRHAEVLWRQEEFVAVRADFEPGERLIVSPMDEALPGMAVRTRSEAAPQQAAATVPNEQEP